MTVNTEEELANQIHDALYGDDNRQVGLSIGPVKNKYFSVFIPATGETYIVSVHNLVERKNKD